MHFYLELVSAGFLKRDPSDLRRQKEVFKNALSINCPKSLIPVRREKRKKNLCHCKEINLYFSGWLEEKNSVTNQELLSAERHQSEKVVNPDLSRQIQRQYFGMSTAPSAKIHSTNTSVEELSGGSIRKIKMKEAICFLNQEKKTPKPPESDSSKDVSSKLDNSSCSGKPASLALASKWGSDDSDLNNFIMMRSKHTVTQGEEKNYVDRPEKGM